MEPRRKPGSYHALRLPMPPLANIVIPLGSIGLVVFAWYAGGILARRRLDRRLARSTAGQGVIALTYDDGPGRTATPDLLDLLAHHEIPATFFLIGRSAEQAPELVDRIDAEGHTVAWHTQSHRNQWKSDPIRGLLDLVGGDFVSGPRLGDRPVFRPPYGKLTLGTVLVALARRWTIATWTHVSGDTHPTLPDPKTVVAEVEASGGGVVLMHDMDRDDPARAAFVLDTTRGLIELARRRQWRFVSTPDEWSAIT